ncbi:CHAT domain-containing protein/lipopolysaccharide biosynthesis regulator YciM [Flavobacterium sp. 28YEA47A]|uniref:CHAT domain-containing protein n=1 Tax=Flavobacterium sp. 28YEA47A TaxID=3156276 RepID=UPI0035117CE9
MKRLLFLILFTQLAFAQKQTLKEEELYSALDHFIANPTLTGIKNLEITERQFWSDPKPKSKNELLALVILDCNKAFYQKEFGFYFDAIRSYETALLLFQNHQLDNYDIIEYCLKPLGNLYTVTGDYTSAENTIKQYLFLAIKNNNTEQKISAIINLAAVYKSIGKSREAIDLLESQPIEKLSPEKKSLLLSLLGENYILLGNYENSRKALEKAESIAPNFVVYKNLSIVYRQKKKYSKAEEYISKAKSNLTDASKRDVSQVYLEEAKLFLAQNKITESQRAIQAIFKELIPGYDSKTVLPKEKNLYSEHLLIDALEVLASIYTVQKNYQKAIDCYTLTFAIDSRFSNVFFYEETSFLHTSNIRNRVEKAIGIYEQLFHKTKDTQFLKLAFELQETTKSKTLKNYIALTKKTGNEKQKEILYKIHDLSAIVIKEQEKGESANLEVINSTLSLQNEKIAELKKTFGNNSIGISQSSKFDMDRLFVKLKNDDATLTAYFYGKDTVYIFDVAPDGIRLKSFSNSLKNKKIITDYLDYFTQASAITNNLSGYRKQSFALHQLLALKKIKNQKHLIIPDGLLSFVSFESLLTTASQSTDFSKLPYLMKDEIISYDTSADFYLNNKSAHSKDVSILGVFPVFENSNRSLTFTLEEMKAIQKLFPGVYLEKSLATYDHFIKESKKHTILHLSTHATSGTVEVPAAISFYDQDIVYSNLYSLDIRPDLVVLSACETGIGKLYRGEGALSIARGFQNAGAKNLLFSLWKVNDFTTSLLMKNFYTNYKKGMSYPMANHKAKIEFLNDETIPNSKKSPYYWSAFVFYGTISEDTTSNYWYLFGGAILILSCLIILQKQNKVK